jgi:hypothetical protein
MVGATPQPTTGKTANEKQEKGRRKGNQGKSDPFPAISHNRKKITNRKIDIPINHKKANRNI